MYDPHTRYDSYQILDPVDVSFVYAQLADLYYRLLWSTF